MIFFFSELLKCLHWGSLCAMNLGQWEIQFFNISRIVVTVTTQMQGKNPKQTQTNLKYSKLILNHPKLTKNSVVPGLIWIYWSRVLDCSTWLPPAALLWRPSSKLKLCVTFSIYNFWLQIIAFFQVLPVPSQSRTPVPQVLCSR